MKRLRSVRNFPRDGYWYKQTDGIEHVFPSEGGISQLTTRVSQFRVANKLNRSSWQETYEDIEAFTVARLSVNPKWAAKWIVDTDAPLYIPPTKVKGAKGGCCGARIS